MPREVHVLTKNDVFQTLEVLLRNRQKRTKQRRFLVHGVRSINALHDAEDWSIDSLVYAANRPLSDWAKGVLTRARAETHVVLPPALHDELSEREEGAELIAVARMRDDDVSALWGHPRPLYLVLDRPSNPGNLGTILRSADALGASGVVVVGHAADLYEPKVVRAAAGSFFSVPVVRAPSLAEIDAWLDKLRTTHPTLRVLGTTAKAGAHPADEDLSGPAVLMFGNETTGLSRGLTERADAMLSLEMAGAASSLNLGAAVTLFVYEASRQRRG